MSGNFPDPPKFWESVEAHIKLLNKHDYTNSAQMLVMYEEERKRQTTAITNLESQLTTLSDALRKATGDHGRLVGILRRAGMDVETLIRTDEIFGDGSTADNILPVVDWG